MSSKSKEQIFAQIKRQMTQRGYANHFQAAYVNYIAQEVMNSDRDNLKPQFKYKDQIKYAIADKFVHNFLIKNPNLELTKATIELENPLPFPFSCSNNFLQIQCREGPGAFRDILEWNEERVAELRKIEEEKERIAEEQKIKEEQERLLHEEEEEELERQKEAQARSIAASYRSGLGVKFITKTPISLLPEGARSPPPSVRPNSPNTKSVIVYNLNNPKAVSTFGEPNFLNDKTSVISAPIYKDANKEQPKVQNKPIAESTRPQKTRKTLSRNRPSAINTGVTPNGSSASTPLN